ncbi:MAG TPA: hypothetical protein VF229_02970 [Burkholderiaceae bacterium]
MSEDVELQREMGCTRTEFLGWLPGATRHAPVVIDGDLIRVRQEAGEVTFRIRQAPERRLGLIALPVLDVRIRFVGMDAAARERFLQHFDLYTRRGGG